MYIYMHIYIHICNQPSITLFVIGFSPDTTCSKDVVCVGVILRT